MSLRTLPQGYTMRSLQITDIDLGFLDCLADLAPIGDVSPLQFQSTYQMMQSFPGMYNIHVVTNELGKVVACGTLFIEQKFLRNAGKVYLFLFHLPMYVFRRDILRILR